MLLSLALAWLSREGPMLSPRVWVHGQGALVDARGRVLELTQHSGAEEELCTTDLVLHWLHAKCVEQFLANVQHWFSFPCR
jgi:hypothetical protein